VADWLGFPEVVKTESETSPATVPQYLVTHPKFDPDELLTKIVDRIAALDV